jgi:RNA polymerase sigma-70 factor (ECF subfamily)
VGGAADLGGGSDPDTAPGTDASATPADASALQEHRAHLIRVGYRLTSSLADAEDAVQEAWLRLARLAPADRAAIRDLRGWLTTVVSRLCLDKLRSAAAQRERYVGSWLPEPLVTRLDGPEDPLDEVVRDEGVRMAALLVLEKLNPEQRVAFVLHDALGLQFGEIADVLGCSVAAARQYASRARRTVAGAEPPAPLDLAEQRRVLDDFLAALATGNLAAVVGLLHPDVVVVGDSGGKEPTARRPVRGADKAARFILGLLQRYGAPQLAASELVLVNGEIGMLVPASPGDEEHAPLARRVSVFEIHDGRVTAIYDVVNPDKLTRLPR